jgi:hypothetical protein
MQLAVGRPDDYIRKMKQALGEVEAKVEAETRRERVLDDRPAFDFDQTPQSDDAPPCRPSSGIKHTLDTGARRSIIQTWSFSRGRRCAGGDGRVAGTLRERSNAMGKGRDRVVYQKPDCQWANKRNDASKASSLHKTQADAIEAARENLKNQGGGELTVKARRGPFRDKDTVPPGNDPPSTRG